MAKKRSKPAPQIVREAILARAAQMFDSILVCRMEDTEQSYGDVWHVRAIMPGGEQRSGCDKDIRNAFREAMGEDLGKQCYTCLEIKQPALFSKDKTRHDGLCQRCKKCERIRKGMGDRKRGIVRDDADDPDPFGPHPEE